MKISTCSDTVETESCYDVLVHLCRKRAAYGAFPEELGRSHILCELRKPRDFGCAPNRRQEREDHQHGAETVRSPILDRTPFKDLPLLKTQLTSI